MGWKYKEIEDGRRAKALEKYATATHDELIERIVALETTLEPLLFVLGSLDMPPGPRESVYASSKLFPLLSNDDHFLVHKPGENGGSSEELKIPDDQLHKFEYYTQDSLSFKDGTKLDDTFEVISVHQSVMCGYMYCGSITMGDIRKAVGVLEK